LRTFYEKRISQEVSAECLADEWKGYVVRISGGNKSKGKKKEMLAVIYR